MNLHMKQDEQLHHWLEEAVRLNDRHYSTGEILRALQEKGMADDLADDVMNELKKQIRHKRRHRGQLLVLIGGIILVAGFLTNVLLFHNNESFSYVLYGTSITGILVLFFGLMDIF